MTLPDERYRSLAATERFLKELLSPTMTPRVPREIRQRARGLLRHWPDSYHFELICQALPQHFAKDMEPLHRMILAHEQDRDRGISVDCTIVKSTEPLDKDQN